MTADTPIKPKPPSKLDGEKLTPEAQDNQSIVANPKAMVASAKRAGRLERFRAALNRACGVHAALLG